MKGRDKARSIERYASSQKNKKAGPQKSSLLRGQSNALPKSSKSSYISRGNQNGTTDRSRNLESETELKEFLELENLVFHSGENAPQASGRAKVRNTIGHVSHAQYAAKNKLGQEKKSLANIASRDSTSRNGSSFFNKIVDESPKTKKKAIAKKNHGSQKTKGSVEILPGSQILTTNTNLTERPLLATLTTPQFGDTTLDKAEDFSSPAGNTSLFSGLAKAQSIEFNKYSKPRENLQSGKSASQISSLSKAKDGVNNSRPSSNIQKERSGKQGNEINSVPYNYNNPQKYQLPTFGKASNSNLLTKENLEKARKDRLGGFIHKHFSKEKDGTQNKKNSKHSEIGSEEQLKVSTVIQSRIHNAQKEVSISGDDSSLFDKIPRRGTSSSLNVKPHEIPSQITNRSGILGSKNKVELETPRLNQARAISKDKLKPEIKVPLSSSSVSKPFKSPNPNNRQFHPLSTSIQTSTSNSKPVNRGKSAQKKVSRSSNPVAGAFAPKLSYSELTASKGRKLTQQPKPPALSSQVSFREENQIIQTLIKNNQHKNLQKTKLINTIKGIYSRQSQQVAYPLP